MGNASAAVTDISEALRLLSPKDQAFYHNLAMHNLAVALAAGSIADVAQAAKQLRAARKLFRGVRGLSVERAKMSWTEGMILYRLGCDRRAEKLLESARKTLIQLRMPQEVAAITADLARLHHPDRCLIRGLVEDLRSFYEEMTQPLRAHVVKLHQATRTSGLRAEEGMLAAIHELRDIATSGAVAPSFLT